ncbi:restriction endonuclease subunit S [Pediococcus sp. EKM202D]|uniref:restriction endonuclease subunit S n=2 Tax=unclassified Pediococcus TaxID=554805 RepID=UPI00142D471D|nr:restriction endonuclease subunit S [Pediococcus sp. EKM202D]KAF5438239.1 restriction endonuclease subunit S [Pediococcus sp. EKM202D]
MQDKVQKMSPEIRFKGYTDAWVLRKLNDIGNTYNSLSGKSKEDFNHGDAHYVTYLNVFNNPVSSKNGIEKIEIDSKQQQVKYGDIFFTTSSETPEEVGMSSVWIYNIPNTYLNSFCFGYRLNVKYNLFFLSYVFRNIYFRKQIIKLAQGISRYNISKKKVLQLSISIPKLGEQEAIGSLFKKFDDLIALQQRKIDTLKLLKKALLQQMFPEKEEDIPKVRFTNFTVKWGQQKLKSILILRNEQMTENKEYLLKSFVKNKGIISKSERYDRSFLLSNSNKKYKKTELSDFIYSSNNLETGSIGINRTGKALISPVYSIFYAKHHIYSEFIGLLSTKKKFINDMIRLRQGVIYGQWKIRESDFLEIVVQMPSKSEMKFITNFMFNIDLAIDIYNKKLNKFRVVKESLLQKMFL